MKIRLSLVLFVLLLFAAAWGLSVITGYAAPAAAEGVARASFHEPVNPGAR